MKKNNYSLRKFINDIHLWLGLASGIVLFLVCFSGTILTFDDEIKALFTDKVAIDASVSEKASVASLIQTLEQSNQGYITGLTLPSNTDVPYEFSVKKDLKERRGSQVLVNPYTSSVHSVEKTRADAFMMSMFKLHRWLLLDIAVGRPIVGIATIIFLVLAISGIVLWFPKKIKWKTVKHGFKIKTNANWKRINHDLHNTLGFYACVFILIMGITGLCWSFEGYKDLLGRIMGTKIFDRTSTEFEIPKTAENDIISIDEALAIANTTLNYPGELSVSFPNKKNNYYTFRKSNDNNWSPVTRDNLYMSLNGTVLAVEWFKEKPLNVRVAALIKPLHTGEIYGQFSKIIYFLACLIATSLPVTGTIIWIHKLKKKKKKKKL
ncbi:PepSY-associated TM helix domain-containing protein [Mariniflexile ostreae]|uniref:PepSY-associated TM helix domain-containing protein n=1 Tax=Mariniflexile ostreae TaxID=1520892 RepID=A0ABV5F8M8_9FLAO